MIVTEGDLMDIIRLYRLTSEFKLESLQYLHILPASFAGYIPRELVLRHIPSYVLSIPEPSAVYASNIHIMVCHPPVASPVLITLEAEPHTLIVYHLLGIPAGSLRRETDEVTEGEIPSQQPGPLRSSSELRRPSSAQPKEKKKRPTRRGSSLR
jgi:hypothetical protein